MDWKQLTPYIVPLLIVALLARRVMRAQKAQAVKMHRLWIVPAILLVMTALTLANGPKPSILAGLAFCVAAVAGGALGWYRVHTLEFSVDPESGAVLSKSTPFGAFLLVGLLLFRYVVKFALSDEGIKGVDLVLFTEGGLLFSGGMMIAQSVHTWVRARKLTPQPVQIAKE